LYNFNMNKLPAEFKKLEKIGNPFKQRLYFVGILTKYLNKQNIRPIVVGGHAVEFYTLGSYTTADIDLVSEKQEEIENILTVWGFKKIGRLWVFANMDIEVDIVASNLENDDISKITEVDVEGLKVYFIGIEDLIIDRLNAFVWWNSQEDGKWAEQITKLHWENIDKLYIEKRARKEDVLKAWEKVKNEKI
jgi:predicted nucleotidyltransferase